MSNRIPPTDLKSKRLKSNDNRFGARFIYPMPPEAKEAKREMEIYARFMRHMRCVTSTQQEFKILSSIQFTADLLNESDGFVAKFLVEMGLRAPRKAFPNKYLDHVDQSLLRSGIEFGSPTQATLALHSHWKHTGEEETIKVHHSYAHTEAPHLVET